MEQGPSRQPLNTSLDLRVMRGCWQGVGWFRGVLPPQGPWGLSSGMGTLLSSPSSKPQRAAPPARAVVTFPSEGRHACASLGFSTYIQISSC